MKRPPVRSGRGLISYKTQTAWGESGVVNEKPNISTEQTPGPGIVPRGLGEKFSTQPLPSLPTLFVTFYTIFRLLKFS